MNKKMSFWMKCWIVIIRLSLSFYFKAHILQTWSWIHQRIFDRQFDKEQITLFRNMKDLTAWIKKFQWRRDGWTEFFDAFCTPQKTHAMGQRDDNTVTYRPFGLFTVKMKHGNDCDEAARFLAYSINRSIKSGFIRSEGILMASVMTVVWTTPEGVPSGHNVALIRHLDGTWSYMDYRAPSEKKKTIQEVVDLVRNHYSPKGYNSVFWALSDPDSLAPIMTSWK